MYRGGVLQLVWRFKDGSIGSTERMLLSALQGILFELEPCWQPADQMPGSQLAHCHSAIIFLYAI